MLAQGFLRSPIAHRTELDRALGWAVREVRMLAAATPSNLVEERRRLLSGLERGDPPVPRFVYAPADRRELRRGLEILIRGVPSVVEADLAEIYRARIEELDLEARIAEASGSRLLGELSNQRFGDDDAVTGARTTALAQEWLAIPPSASGRSIPSDSADPESLVSQMRREVGALRLPFRVEVRDSLSSRAATGERTIWVGKGRALTEREARRIVVHEVLGHALPRARAARRSPIFAIGTARGADDQEGLALLLEARSGLLDGARRRELAARHWAVEGMSRGAAFADIVGPLVRDHRFSMEAALAVAERAYRGGDGRCPGLGRERVYLGAWLRLREHLARRPLDEGVLASGQVALRAVGALSREGDAHGAEDCH